jgi:hypothetical protein
MRIAVFDYKVVPTNPIGSCHLRMLQGLCREHEFTVFAVEFENSCPERIGKLGGCFCYGVYLKGVVK